MNKFLTISVIALSVLNGLSLGQNSSATIKPIETHSPKLEVAEEKKPGLVLNTVNTFGYSHENTSKLSNSEWMHNIEDTVLLSSLSLPGTHESMSLLGGDIPQCQTLTLEAQLRAGIRVFDIRCRHKSNSFRIQHEYVDQNVDFNQVLGVFVQFLAQNPTEALLVRIREEYKPNNNNQSFEETFREYITQDPFPEYMWAPTSVNPTLGDVRGKIVVLQDFSAKKMYGLDYQTFDIQDEYEIKTIFRLYEKWEKVKKQLMRADKLTRQNTNFIVNYLSGATGYIGQFPLLVLPYFVASGRSDHRTNSPLLLTGRTTLINREVYPDFPRVYCLGSFCLIAFEGTNELTLRFIQNEKPEFVGIVMIDFPGDALIDTIIKLNKLSNALNKQKDYSTEPSVLVTIMANSTDRPIVQDENMLDQSSLIIGPSNTERLETNNYQNSDQMLNPEQYSQTIMSQNLNEYQGPRVPLESIQMQNSKLKSESNSKLKSKPKSNFESNGKLGQKPDITKPDDSNPISDANKPINTNQIFDSSEQLGAQVGTESGLSLETEQDDSNLTVTSELPKSNKQVDLENNNNKSINIDLVTASISTSSKEVDREFEDANLDRPNYNNQLVLNEPDIDNEFDNESSSSNDEDYLDKLMNANKDEIVDQDYFLNLVQKEKLNDKSKNSLKSVDSLKSSQHLNDELNEESVNSTQAS